MKALACGGQEGTSISKVKSNKRCKWWNRGYCREQERCQFSHQGEDCEEHLMLGHCTTKGCRQRHRKRWKYWNLKEGCYRGLECQYLHMVKDNPQENKLQETDDKEVQAETKTKEYHNIGAQTEVEEKYIEVCACTKETVTNELLIKDNKLICILNRERCTNDEWEDIEQQAEESGMDLEEFLEVIAKVLEGHFRRAETKKEQDKVK